MKEDEGWWHQETLRGKWVLVGSELFSVFSGSVVHRLASLPKRDAGKEPGGSYMPCSDLPGRRDEPELARMLSQHIQYPPLAAVPFPTSVCCRDHFLSRRCLSNCSRENRLR